MTSTWTSTNSRAARRIVRGRGRFQTCWRCGREMDLDTDKWHAGHAVDRALGGDDRDVLAECVPCNVRAGARLGGQRKAQRRRAVAAQDQRLISW